MIGSMVHGHGRRLSLGSNKSSSESIRAEEEETVVDEGEKNILLSIISQLRPGADLSRITLPTFILEPKSMLERITNFMQHPETLLPMPTIDDPEERFIAVLKFYLSGWHLRPTGVKKPLNPCLGEFYTCYWEYPDKTKGYYIAEQTSHHPPKSSYFFMAPEHHIRIDGTLKPRSRFLGNSAASMMEGIAVLRFLNRGDQGGEKYLLTQPNMYVRGILFGKMKFELGDHSFVRCPELDLVADVEFKTKGYFTGSYDAIGGHIKRESTGELLYEISGKWNEEMWLRNLLTSKRELLFDAINAKPTPPIVRPIREQEERESRKLWTPVITALLRKDQQGATEEKLKIEDRQRDEARLREADGVEWRPRFFRPMKAGEEDEELDFILSHNIDGTTPEEKTDQILSITPILAGAQPSASSRRYDIPQYHRERHDSKISQESNSESTVNNNTIDTKIPKTTAAGKTTSSTSISAADLIDFGDANENLNDLQPALIPTSAGIAEAGKINQDKNGNTSLDTMNDVNRTLPREAGNSAVVGKSRSNSLLDDSDNDVFEDAQGSLI